MSARVILIRTCLICFALSMHGALRAAEAPLAAWVGDDLGLCVETHDLRGSYDTFANSELLTKWQAHPLTRSIWQRRAAELGTAAQQIRSRLGLSPSELLREFAADDALFAVWPGARVDTPSSGLLMIRSTQHVRIRTTVEYVTRRSQSEPRAADETLDVGDRRAHIYRLNLGSSKPSLLLVHIAGDEIRGSLAILSSHRAAIDRVLQGIQGQAVARALFDHPAYQRGQTNTLAAPTFRMFIQPRSWDAIVLSGDEPRDERARRLRTLTQDTWRAVTGLTLALNVHRDVELHAHLDLDEAILPPESQRLLSVFAGSTTVLERAPLQALAVVQLRCDLRGMLSELFLPSEQHASLLPLPKDASWPVVAALLSSLGPDFQATIVPTQSSAADGTTGLPITWIAKLASQPPIEGAETTPPAETMVSLLRVWAQFQAARQTTEGASPKVNTLTVQEHAFTQFHPRNDERGLPWLVTAHRNALWLGSSASEVVDAMSATTPAAIDAPGGNAAQQSLSVDLLNLRRVLRESRSGLEKWRALKALSSQDAERQWDVLVRLLDLADHLDAELSVAPDRIVGRAKLSVDSSAK